MSRKTGERGVASSRKAVTLLTLGNLTAPIASFVTAPLLAHGLGVDGRGEMAAATAPLLLAAAGLTLGVPESMTYFVARGTAGRRQTLWWGLAGSLLLGVIGSVAITLLAGPLSAGDDYVRKLIIVIGLALVPSLLATSVRGYARGLQAWNLVALDQGFASVFRVVGTGALFLTDTMTPLSAGIVAAVANFIGILVYIVGLTWSRTRPVGVNPPDETRLTGWAVPRSMLGYGLGVWLGAAAGILLARLDQVLILPISTAAVLGVYAVAVSITDVVRVFNLAVRDVVFSKQSATTDDEALARASRVSTLLTALTGVAVVALAWVVVPPLFGEEFRDATSVIAVLAIGTVLGNPGSVLAAGLSARGRPILRSIAIVVGVVVNVATLYVFVPPWGAVGAAVSTGVANVSTGAMVLFFAHRYFGLGPSRFLRIGADDVRFLVRIVRDRLPGRKKVSS